MQKIRSAHGMNRNAALSRLMVSCAVGVGILVSVGGAPAGATGASTVPSAPAAVTATPEYGQVVLSWSAPGSDGGSTITSYTASDGLGDSCTTAATSCIVKGLTNGSKYTFTVVATNANGDSSGSVAVQQTSIASVASPREIALDGAGHLFIADAAGGDVVSMNTDGTSQTAIATGLSNPEGVAVDGSGHVFVSDSFNSRILEMNADGSNQTVLASDVLFPGALAVDGSGHLFIASNGRVVTMNTDGTDQAIVASGLNAPNALAVDGSGHLFVGTLDGYVREMGTDGSGQTVIASGLLPNGLALDGEGHLFASDGSTGTLVEMNADGSNRSTYADEAFAGLSSIAVDGSGTVFASAANSSSVLRLSRAIVPVAAVPGNPTNISAISGNTTAIVSWMPPVDDGGQPITHYTVTAIDYTSTGNGGETCVSNDPIDTCTLTGLTNGDEYGIKVVATNAASDSQGGYGFVIPAVPVELHWKAPISIKFGTPISGLQNDAGAPIPGRFDYSIPGGTVLGVGLYTLTATFTPDDPAYASGTISTTITVTRISSSAAVTFTPTVRYGTEDANSFSVHVLGHGGFPGIGVVTVRVGQLELCTRPLDHGAATCSLGATQLRRGQYRVSVRFHGTADMRASTSTAPQRLTVSS